MSEQALTDTQPLDAQENPDVSHETQEATAPPPAEAKAEKVGWRPKDEYVANGGDPGKWVDADEFLRVRETLSSLRSKEIKRFERQLAARDEADRAREERIARLEKQLNEQSQART